MYMNQSQQSSLLHSSYVLHEPDFITSYPFPVVAKLAIMNF